MRFYRVISTRKLFLDNLTHLLPKRYTCSVAKLFKGKKFPNFFACYSFIYCYLHNGSRVMTMNWPTPVLYEAFFPHARSWSQKIKGRNAWKYLVFTFALGSQPKNTRAEFEFNHSFQLFLSVQKDLEKYNFLWN